MRLIIFWKMVRLESMRAPDNKDHWTTFRDTRRKILYGSNNPPADKTVVDLMAIDSKLAQYARVVVTMS